MRVAMVAACPFPSPQGSQVFIRQMCERLALAGHDIHLLTYGQGEEVTAAGYRHHRIARVPGDDALRSGPRVVKPLLDAMMMGALSRLLGKARFDVVHCHNYEAAVVGLAVRVRRRVPVVYHSHNLMGDELSTYFRARATRRLASVVGRALDASVPRAADQVVALCNYSAGVLRAFGVEAERMTVIPPAVDDAGPAGPREDARRVLGLPGSRPLIGYCGNLDGYQNLDLLLDALSELGSSSSVTLLMATHFPAARFHEVSAARGLVDRVRLVVARDYERARLAMAAADVLVLPRRHGSGYPIKLLNYMGLGRPIVAAGCGAKLLQPGQDALVVADDDPRALAAAIRRLLADRVLADGLATAARARFLRELTWDAVLPAIEAVYRRCAGSKALPTRHTPYNVFWRDS
jgi:glycosyltransferase involved in cell wall biosynthesis